VKWNSDLKPADLLDYTDRGTFRAPIHLLDITDLIDDTAPHKQSVNAWSFDLPDNLIALASRIYRRRKGRWLRDRYSQYTRCTADDGVLPGKTFPTTEQQLMDLHHCLGQERRRQQLGAATFNTELRMLYTSPIVSIVLPEDIRAIAAEIASPGECSVHGRPFMGDLTPPSSSLTLAHAVWLTETVEPAITIRIHICCHGAGPGRHLKVPTLGRESVVSHRPALAINHAQIIIPPT
jgi:hypothetical protein